MALETKKECQPKLERRPKVAGSTELTSSEYSKRKIKVVGGQMQNNINCRKLGAWLFLACVSGHSWLAYNVAWLFTFFARRQRLFFLGEILSSHCSPPMLGVVDSFEALLVDASLFCFAFLRKWACWAMTMFFLARSDVVIA